MTLWIIVTVLVIICLALLAELARSKEEYSEERRRLTDEAEYLRLQITALEKRLAKKATRKEAKK
jgi:hypothetical protein